MLQKSFESQLWPHPCFHVAGCTAPLRPRLGARLGLLAPNSTSSRHGKGSNQIRCQNIRAEAMDLTHSNTPPSSTHIINDNGHAEIQAYGHAAHSIAAVLTDSSTVTGGALDFKGASESLTRKSLIVTKKVVLVRHGLSTWNEESRIQGSSDLSLLSDKGVLQAQKCRRALANLNFAQCFASPISRAKSTAEVIWEGKKEPLVFLDTLKEANLQFLEGMKNEDAAQKFPDLYTAWREDPSNFHVNGVYPVVDLWERAKSAWSEMLSVQGELVLVVTHKSILRALICTALGMGPERFRSVDINNGGISVFNVNKRGEPMLQNLNLTAHLHTDDITY